MPKRSIRTQFLNERKSRPIQSCVDLSNEIQQRFLLSEMFSHAECLALYSAINNEVMTELVASRVIARGKTLAYPRINNDDLEFVVVKSLSDLHPGRFGVLEPRGLDLVPVKNLDLVVVPGVVFDRTGHRLGYGRGFYDRALKGCRDGCVKAGFAFDFQVIEKLPAAEHDELLSVLVTETCLLDFTT
jgi:5-formyltetrahydrofolate cyclo-ligase